MLVNGYKALLLFQTIKKWVSVSLTLLVVVSSVDAAARRSQKGVDSGALKDECWMGASHCASAVNTSGS